MRILVFTTHPIQYQSPWFRYISNQTDVELKVIYSYLPDLDEQSQGFGDRFLWDVELTDGFEWDALKTIRIKGQGFFSKVAINIGSVIGKFKPDVVVISGWHHFTLTQALYSANIRGIPVIMRGETNGKKHRSHKKSIIHKLYLSRVAAFLAIGRSSISFYRNIGVEIDRIFPSGYFVDNEYFYEKSESLRSDRNSLREAWQIPPTAFCVAFVGKLEPKKHILTALAAIHRARINNRRVVGLVVGSGEQLQQARDFCIENNITATFAGFLNQSRIVEAYVAADAVILPSDYGETWGLVCNEAMACGTPAIVSDRVGCADDLVLDGVTGGVAEFGNPDSFSNRIIEWSSNELVYNNIRNNARKHLLHSYTIEAATTALMAAARHVMDAR